MSLENHASDETPVVSAQSECRVVKLDVAYRLINDLQHAKNEIGSKAAQKLKDRLAEASFVNGRNIVPKTSGAVVCNDNSVVCPYDFLEVVEGLGVHLHTFGPVKLRNVEMGSISFFHVGFLKDPKLDSATSTPNEAQTFGARMLRSISRVLKGYDFKGTVFNQDEARDLMERMPESYDDVFYESLGDILKIAKKNPSSVDGLIFIDPVELLNGREDGVDKDIIIKGNLFDNQNDPALKDVAEMTADRDMFSGLSSLVLSCSACCGRSVARVDFRHGLTTLICDVKNRGRVALCRVKVNRLTLS